MEPLDRHAALSQTTPMRLIGFGLAVTRSLRQQRFRSPSGRHDHPPFGMSGAPLITADVLAAGRSLDDTAEINGEQRRATPG
jgi:hypothetical protein